MWADVRSKATVIRAHRLSKPCLDFILAFEKAVEANVDPVFPALKAMAEPMADTDPCSAGTLLMVDLLENKGLDMTAAFREEKQDLFHDIILLVK